MLERDYIMRLIREFAEALELLLKKDIKKQSSEITYMYDRYVGPYAFYHTADIDDIMASFEQYNANERLQRMEMLAELYYAEANIKSGPSRDDLLQKALVFFSFIDRHDKTYSMDRLNKISDIKRRITA